jgi:hypothetical protein
MPSAEKNYHCPQAVTMLENCRMVLPGLQAISGGSIDCVSMQVLVVKLFAGE